MKLLLVEDDRAIAAGLTYSLEGDGYEVVHCSTAAEAAVALEREDFGLCIFDLGLPDGSGYDLCAQAKRRAELPVIFLTAYDDEGSVVMGLDMGADDYITKPFRLRELLSRVKSVLRRYGRGDAAGGGLGFADVRIQPLEAKVLRGGREIPLTALEYRLLLTLASNPGQVLTRGQLLEGIWDIGGDFVNDNTLTVYVKRLREKLGDDMQEPRLIKTVRGIGYKVEKDGSQ